VVERAGGIVSRSDWRWDHHPTCPCGCGELADECAGPRRSPLGSMTITPPRTAVALTPMHDDDKDDDR
jgi:hypothetical protein